MQKSQTTSHYLLLYFCSTSIKDSHSGRQTLQQKALPQSIRLFIKEKCMDMTHTEQ